MLVECENGSYVPRFSIDACCNPDCNGEHRLLDKIIKSVDSKKTVHIFDVGARNSKYPNYTDKHKLHLFDPEFKHEPGVDYTKDNVVIINKALNSRDFTLDSYCSSNGIQEIEFLKIDTDGHDVDVLRGATEILKNTKYVQVEYDMYYLAAGQSVYELHELLKGRKIYKITPFGLEPKEGIVHNFLYANYLFTNEDINYEPHVLNEEFFKGLFWESNPDDVSTAYRTKTKLFTHFNDIQGWKEMEHATIGKYLSRYIPDLVEQYKKNV